MAWYYDDLEGYVWQDEGEGGNGGGGGGSGLDFGSSGDVAPFPSDPWMPIESIWDIIQPSIPNLPADTTPPAPGQDIFTLIGGNAIAEIFADIQTPALPQHALTGADVGLPQKSVLQKIGDFLKSALTGGTSGTSGGSSGSGSTAAKPATGLAAAASSLLMPALLIGGGYLLFRSKK